MLQALRRRLLRRLLAALGRGQGAHRVALAVAVGVAVGLSPLFGLHTPIAFGLAILLRLNKLDAVFASLINNPLTAVPYYSSATALGLLLLGRDTRSLADLPWADMSGFGFWRDHGVATFGPFLGALVLGSLVLSAVGGLVTYAVVRNLLELVARRRGARRERARRRTAGPPPA